LSRAVEKEPRHSGHEPNEAGFVGGFEALLFGLLIFVAGTLLATHAWAVVDTKAATEAAAQQAVRDYVEAASPAAAASQAKQGAAAALAGYGRSAGRVRVRLVSGSFGRCQRITIAVSYPAPVLMLPWVGRVGAAEWVRADHSELVDPFRSGLPGSSTCA
jgi:Na+-driven multidrug efflux pump